jgi:hypothetical protein
MEWIGAQNPPEFYRVLQTQRVVWAEKQDGKLHLRKRHAGSIENMHRGAEAYEREAGRFTVIRATSQ